MDASNSKRRMPALLFGIGLLIGFTALWTVSDANIRHAVGAVGVVIALVGLGLRLKARRDGVRPW